MADPYAPEERRDEARAWCKPLTYLKDRPEEACLPSFTHAKSPTGSRPPGTKMTLSHHGQQRANHVPQIRQTPCGVTVANLGGSVPRGSPTKWRHAAAAPTSPSTRATPT
ncbi:hypothetical protein PG988_016257 [Apiospora saccharicola]